MWLIILNFLYFVVVIWDVDHLHENVISEFLLYSYRWFFSFQPCIVLFYYVVNWNYFHFVPHSSLLLCIKLKLFPLCSSFITWTLHSIGGGIGKGWKFGDSNM
jgi:hypothetical protein